MEDNRIKAEILRNRHHIAGLWSAFSAITIIVFAIFTTLYWSFLVNYASISSILIAATLSVIVLSIVIFFVVAFIKGLSSLSRIQNELSELARK